MLIRPLARAVAQGAMGDGDGHPDGRSGLAGHGDLAEQDHGVGRPALTQGAGAVAPGGLKIGGGIGACESAHGA